MSSQLSTPALRGLRRWLLLALLFTPTSLLAQVHTTVSSFLAADGSIRGAPLLAGGTLGAEAGPLALRLNAAVDSRLVAPVDSASRPWSVEADAILYLRNPRGPGRVAPYAVAGVGLRSFWGRDAAPVPGTLSYGGGLRTRLWGPLALESELRHRRLLIESTEFVPEGVSSGWEFRAGITLRLGERAGFSRAPSLSSAGRTIASRTLDTADDYLGIHYQWGGDTPSGGFDCSGFVRYVYAQHGVVLPRVSRDQARAGAPVPLEVDALQPGDLLAFATEGSEVDHIAIYAGNGQIIHSSSSGGGVRVDRLDSSRGQWYLHHWVAARRVIGLE